MCSWLVTTSEERASHRSHPTLSPRFALPLWGKALVEWRQQTRSPSVGAASEEQQHFKWNVGFSRHTVINFSSASSFEAGEGGRPAGLQMNASNNNPGLSQTKGRRGKGTWNEKQQKKILCLQYVNKEPRTKSMFSHHSWKKYTCIIWYT